mmetsp:Transcript_6026/g.17150  ORF Transcript_6026/g.17150 Transcript_6026/m.17150 type:complete len:123 (-) Transcript_6026:4-372(-)
MVLSTVMIRRDSTCCGNDKDRSPPIFVQVKTIVPSVVDKNINCNGQKDSEVCESTQTNSYQTIRLHYFRANHMDDNLICLGLMFVLSSASMARVLSPSNYANFSMRCCVLADVLLRGMHMYK